MPYTSEKIKLSEKQDRRRKLTAEQKVKIVQLYGTGLHSLRSLGRQFGVDKSMISILDNPIRAAAVSDRIKNHWQDYATTGEERNVIMREHRKYKHELFKSGNLGKDDDYGHE